MIAASVKPSGGAAIRQTRQFRWSKQGLSVSVKTDDVVARSFVGRALSRQKYVEKAIVTENTAQSKSRKDDVVSHSLWFCCLSLIPSLLLLSLSLSPNGSHKLEVRLTLSSVCAEIRFQGKTVTRSILTDKPR